MINIPLDIPVILTGAIIAQGIFAAILLFLHPNNKAANRYLALLLFFFSCWLVDSFFNLGTVYNQNPNFYFLPIYYSLAFGPLIYFYTKSITQKEFIFSTRHLWHFGLVFLQFMLYVFLQCKDYTFRRWFWQEIHQPFTYQLEFILSLSSLVIYLILSIRLLKKYRQWINNQYSEVSKTNLNWLKLVLISMTILCFLWLTDILIREIWQDYPRQYFSAIAIGISILVLAAGSLIQANLIDINFDESRTNKLAVSSEYTLDPKLVSRIKNEMLENKYFLNPKLTLVAFSKALGVNPRLVSFHINQGLEISFIDFVNQYRVAAVKEHIKTNELNHFSLLGIALESGFNSKSTFNRVFKKITGKSPSTYQKKAQNVN